MVFSKVGPNQSIEWAQIRISKSFSDGWVVLDANYMLTNPLVKVNLPIPHAVAADLHIRNAPLLAAPLGEGFNRKPGYLGDLGGGEQPISRQTRSIAWAWSFALGRMRHSIPDHICYFDVPLLRMHVQRPSRACRFGYDWVLYEPLSIFQPLEPLELQSVMAFSSKSHPLGLTSLQLQKSRIASNSARSSTSSGFLAEDNVRTPI